MVLFVLTLAGIVYSTSVALATSLTTEERDGGQIFPSVHRIREISHQVAMAVIRQAAAEGLADMSKLSGVDLEDEQQFVPGRSGNPAGKDPIPLRGKGVRRHTAGGRVRSYCNGGPRDGSG